MPDSLVLCALLPRLVGAKVILDIHDPMPEFYASKFQVQLDGTAVRLLRLHERLSTALAHAIITANGNFRDNLVQRDVPTEKITVINNLPDPTLFAPSQAVTRPADRQAFTLIYPGTIAPRYGLEVAIRALPQLVEEAAGIRLLLMGGAQPAYLQELVQLAEQLGVAAHVTFRSPVPVDQVPTHLAQADVGIYPALPDPHMQIATPSKVLEYAAMGLPIVASRLKVLEDLFGDGAVLFCEPGNVQQFAACIIELYRNPARGEELARQARLMVSDAHTWPQEQRRYYALLGQLTGSTLARVATEEIP
jgi:glycosyltransferase involved in cell wall biosynthesis